MTASTVRNRLRRLSSPEKALVLQRFFKTGPGEYGEGDVFVGVKVPELRKLAREYRDLPDKEVMQLLRSVVHEERLLALFILVGAYERGDDTARRRIYELYLKNTRYINNWDLVDGSAYKIVGDYLEKRSKQPLFDLAKSSDLWERRIAVLSTFHYIRRNEFSPTLKIARTLLGDEEDLIHKAVGWMLREVGERDRGVEDGFLVRHYRRMPRTMLRYAIEKYPEAKRQRFLKGKM